MDAGGRGSAGSCGATSDCPSLATGPSRDIRLWSRCGGGIEAGVSRRWWTRLLGCLVCLGRIFRTAVGRPADWMGAGGGPDADGLGEPTMAISHRKGSGSLAKRRSDRSRTAPATQSPCTSRDAAQLRAYRREAGRRLPAGLFTIASPRGSPAGTQGLSPHPRLPRTVPTR